MLNQDAWLPSKYVMRSGKLVASRDPAEVSVSSRLMADIVAEVYAAQLPTYARGRLLDLGCGKVPLYAAYRPHTTSVTCIDWNSADGRIHLDHELDLTAPLPLADGSFDTIVLSDVLEHLPEPESLWREMTRLLAPGGCAIVNVPFYYGLHEAPHDFYRYTAFALRRFVDRSGLALLTLQPYGGAPEIMADLFAKNVTRMPAVGKPIAAFAQWLTAAFVRTSIGRKVSEATREQFPFGYFLVAQKPAVA